MGSTKVQTAFRFDSEILELVKEKAQRRSLHKYNELLMLKDGSDIPL